MNWSSSDRRSRLPGDWPTRRAKVKRRARGMCEAEVHVAACDGHGSECDHVEQGDNHALSNLQWLSGPCHAAKTLLEAQAAGATKREGKRLPREEHPSGISPRA